MIDVSPLQRAAEQPPCDSEAEALCLNGCLVVPARMACFDLGPHLCFPEHQAIWQAMLRVVEGEPDGFWWRVRMALAKPALLGLLEWTPQPIVDDSDDGCLLFMLAFKKIERCTLARCELSVLQGRATALWRVPGTPYSLDERRRLFGSNRDVGFDIP